MRPALPALAAACLLVLAGCTGTPGGPAATTSTDAAATSVTTDGSTTATITEPTATDEDGHYRRYEFTAGRVTVAEIAGREITSRADVRERSEVREGSFAASLFGNGTATYVDVVHGDNVGEEPPGPLVDGAVVRANGTVYRVNATVVERREARGFRVGLEWPADATIRNRSALPPADRRLLDRMRPEDLSGVASVYGGAFWVFSDDTARNRSTLVDGRVHFVRADGRVFRVHSEERIPAVRFRLRYDLVPVADDPVAFVRERLDRLTTPLNATDGPVRELLEKVVDGSTVTWEGDLEDVPRRYQDAEEWLHEHPPEGRVAYVRYDGALYRVSLRKVME